MMQKRRRLSNERLAKALRSNLKQRKTQQEQRQIQKDPHEDLPLQSDSCQSNVTIGGGSLPNPPSD